METAEPQIPQKKDETLNGFLIVAAILVVVIGFIYLLSVQQRSNKCTPIYNPDGTIQTGCDTEQVIINPTPATSVDLLDKLNEDRVSEVDKRLQEAAQELQNKQKAQDQQKSVQTLPQMPQ